MMGMGEPDSARVRDGEAQFRRLASLLNDTASEMAYWVLPAFIASLGAGPAQLGIIEGLAESVASFTVSCTFVAATAALPPMSAPASRARATVSDVSARCGTVRVR